MTTDNALSLEHGYDIRSYEPRMDGRVSIAAICNQMQDAASRHADSLGFGFHDLEEIGHFWVLARLHLTLDRLPGYGERITVQTWPSGHERLVALRDFLISDGNGLIGRGTSSWVTLNAKTHRPDRPENVLSRRFIPDREHAALFPSKAVTRLKEGEHSADLTARRADTDINGHVNNVKYIEYCMEAVPLEWLKTHRCTGLDIQFRVESFAGEVFTATCSPSAPDADRETFLHALTRTDDGKEVVRMQTWWEQV